MKFLFTTFKVYYVLKEQQIGILTKEEQRKRAQDETLCRGNILSTLTDRLYDMYTPMTSIREIQNSLQEKYTAEKEDDILIVGTNMEGINETKKFLSSCFQMKDMNEVDTILGIKVKRHIEGYSDASCITGSNDSKSITVAGKKAEWLRNMLLDIELWPQPMPAISLHCDIQSTLSRAYNEVYNGKSRDISPRHAYIKELISNEKITIEYIRSCKNLADPFTKGLPKYSLWNYKRDGFKTQ
ncbi:zinc finger, CCHC-type containing protein [Tanacetum coccineum]|uniref:Zinc finger, CCHC-type containing protein n=1 Tax=Tanacetum coccineum TaxID=301880 RepID=A0ABQ5FE91_9ASTR